MPQLKEKKGCTAYSGLMNTLGAEYSLHRTFSARFMFGMHPSRQSTWNMKRFSPLALVLGNADMVGDKPASPEATHTGYMIVFFFRLFFFLSTVFMGIRLFREVLSSSSYKTPSQMVHGTSLYTYIQWYGVV